jgi:3-oxoacyl-[acyl-carrier-protein] synthase II
MPIDRRSADVLTALRADLKRVKPSLPDTLPAADDFRFDWQLDSLDLVEFVSRIEGSFDLVIPDDDLQLFVSLDATAQYIRARLDGAESERDGINRTAPQTTPLVSSARAASATTRRRNDVHRDRIVITGVGVQSPLGCSGDELWSRLTAGESAARTWADLADEGHRVTTACRIEHLECEPLRRGATLARAAARQAVEQAGLRLPQSTGVFLGSTIGESFAFEAVAEGRRLRLDDFTVESFVKAVRRDFRLTGQSHAVATACAAGNYAVGAAVQALRDRRAPVALAGGVEPFSRLAMVGFTRSRAMASVACRPFDEQRTGMLLGEGAAVFVLERADDAVRRGATPLAEVVALGLSCDAYHATAPQPDGSGMRRAMESALNAAGLSPDEIGWVNAHGSGTKLSDAAEARALRAIFGDRMPIVSGSKGALGHALGAASALELAISVAGLRAGRVPPTAGHDRMDIDCGIECTRQTTGAPIQWMINNAFAFGGVNSSLVVGRWDS